MDYDLLIIGGGIQGVGIAQAAAAAGWRVGLLERTALAAGTSRASSKLIHGGLRYLETAQIGLVHESLQERALLLRLAPELVHLTDFHIPIYHDSKRPRWQIRAGLSAYALLSGLGKEARFARLPRRLWGDLDGLRTDGLRAVYRYHDAQTDDAALSRAVMHSAQRLGAQLHMPACFVGAQVGNDGVRVDWREGTRQRSAHARVLVNASGAWAAQVLAAITPTPPAPRVELVRGSHIVLDAALARGVYYLEAPQDRRAVFAMPWHGRTLVGTTEVIHSDGPDRVAASAAEVEYLRAVIAHYLPAHAAAPIVERFAGLRVLPAAADRPFARSRETLLLADDAQHPRVLSVLGGKLTTWRSTAEKAIARMARSLPARRPHADTRTLRIEPAA